MGALEARARKTFPRLLRAKGDAELTLRIMERDRGSRSDLWNRGPSRGNKADVAG